MGLSFIIAAGPGQLSHSRFRVPRDSWPLFYCLRFETLPTWRARSPYLFLPGKGSPSYIPGHWVPFLSPPTTRRDTVEVFEPASSRATAIAAPAVFKLPPRQGRRRKHNPSIVEACLPRPLHINGRGADRIGSTVLLPRSCCGRYLRTAAV
jgi:hypothetical protein